MIPLYFTVGDRRGSVLQTFLLRSLAILFGMYLTLALLVFPKAIAITERLKSKKKRRAEEQSLASSAGTPRYVEVPTTDDSGSDSDFTSASTSAKPKFISQTNTRRSGTSETSSAMPSSTTATGSGSGMGSSSGKGSVLRRSQRNLN